MKTIKESPRGTSEQTMKIERKVLLSTLWIFAMFNYIYADVHTLMDPQILNQIITGSVGPIQMTEEMLLGGSILMETATAMVLLSRILKYKANRWSNILVGALHTVVVLASMLGTQPTLYYTFYGTIEVVCTSFIVWYAWKWREQEQ